MSSTILHLPFGAIAAVGHDTALSLVERTASRRAVVNCALAPRVVLAVPGMGTELFWAINWSRMHLSDAFIASLDTMMACSVREFLFDSVQSLDDAKALQQRDLQQYQRLLFAIHMALHHVLVTQCGFRYERLCSFSAGEPSAAALSGAFSMHGGAQLNRAMSRVNQLPIASGIESTMVVCINAPLDTVQRALSTHGGEVGAYIGNNLNAVCGMRTNMDALCADLTSQLPQAIIKQTGLPVAFHSVIFEQFRAQCDTEFAAALQASTAQDSLQLQRVPWHSSIRGGVVDDADARSLEFWFALIRAPARSIDVMQSLIAAQVNVFVELNCHCLYARTFDEMTNAGFLSLPMLDLKAEQADDERLQLARLVTQLWQRGVDLDLDAIGGGGGGGGGALRFE
jgi:rifamycin polyketide synthase module 1/2/3